MMASNMDTVGTFEMAKAIAQVRISRWKQDFHYKLLDMMLKSGILYLQHDMFTTVHKHYTVEAWKQFAAENKDILKVCTSC